MSLLRKHGRMTYYWQSLGCLVRINILITKTTISLLNSMIRFLDLILSIVGFLVFLPVLIILYIIGLFDTGSPLFIQERLGQRQKPFKLVKFRTMQIGTAQVGTHLAKAADITRFGCFLRKTKLDELPQLLNVIKGDMSLVGPRPGLPTQKNLRDEREKRKVFDFKPGITGLGQVNEVDMSTPKKLSQYDALMLKKLNLCWYFKLLFETVWGKGQGDRVQK